MIGSTRLARRAERQHAAYATAQSNTVAPTHARPGSIWSVRSARDKFPRPPQPNDP